MKEIEVLLAPLEPEDREQFISDNQRAFLYGATEEFGLRDDHFEEEGQIISRRTIEETLDGEHAEAWRIMCDGAKAGGLVLILDREHRQGELALLFVKPEAHSRGIGYAAWQAVEKMYPDIDVWETVTPYFEKRNIHFYVNRCGFHIVEFFNSHHPDPNEPEEYAASYMTGSTDAGAGVSDVKDAEHPGCMEDDGMFRFEKILR